jgi:predicted DNA binding CopG/RHH family protein
MKKKTLKPIPKFKNEAQEWEFWQTHDTSDYVDYSKAKRVSIEFDPSVEEPVKLISIRIPRDLLNKLRVMASKLDVPYQSLIKMILAERLKTA